MSYRHLIPQIRADAGGAEEMRACQALEPDWTRSRLSRG